jgi:hypothetical protein
MTKQEKVDNTIIYLINIMFKISNHDMTFDDIKDRKDDWYSQFTMTEEQNNEWKNKGIEYLIKHFKMNKRLAQREMEMFNLNYGLKIV